jgi:hypothetical protein
MHQTRQSSHHPRRRRFCQQVRFFVLRAQLAGRGASSAGVRSSVYCEEQCAYQTSAAFSTVTQRSFQMLAHAVHFAVDLRVTKSVCWICTVVAHLSCLGPTQCMLVKQ